MDEDQQVNIRIRHLSEGPSEDLPRVTVIDPDGELSEVTPDSEGFITIVDAKPGPHAIVASSKVSHGTTLVYVGPATNSSVAKSDRTVRRDVSTEDDEPDVSEEKQMTVLQIGGEGLRPSVDQIRGISFQAATPIMQVAAGESFGHSATLKDGDRLLGQVFSMDPSVDPIGTQVRIFREGKLVGTATAQEEGYFEVGGVQPGVYGLVASGTAGYAAFAFNAIEQNDAFASNAKRETLVAQQASEVSSVITALPVVLVPPAMTGKVIKVIERRYPMLRATETVEPEDGFVESASEFPVAPMGTVGTPLFYGPVGGGGFASGGVGGGSGLAELGALGAVGAATIIATTDDDNNAITTPRPVSNAVPN